jgi:monoamine oxidase
MSASMLSKTRRASSSASRRFLLAEVTLVALPTISATMTTSSTSTAQATKHLHQGEGLVAFERRFWEKTGGGFHVVSADSLVHCRMMALIASTDPTA